MKNTTIYIADDHPILAKGLAGFLESNGYRVLGTENNGIRAYHEIVKLKPEIAILDVEMPEMGGLQILKKVIEKDLDTRIIFFTNHKDPANLKNLLEPGLSGILLKSYNEGEILEGIDQVSKGKKYFKNLPANFPEYTKIPVPHLLLTSSEIKILKFIANELSSKEIAERLFIAERTVEKHRSNIIKKLNLPQKKSALLLWAISQKKSIENLELSQKS